MPRIDELAVADTEFRGTPVVQEITPDMKHSPNSEMFYVMIKS